jgi:hypothetical protein
VLAVPQHTKQMSLYSDDRRKRKWDTHDSSPSKPRPSRDDGERSSSTRDRGSDRYESGSSRHDERASSSSGHRDRGDRRDDRRSASPPRGPRDASKKSRGSGAPPDAAAAAGTSLDIPCLEVLFRVVVSSLGKCRFCGFDCADFVLLAAAAARIAASLNNRNIIPPTIPQNYGSQPVPLAAQQTGPLAITAPPPAHSPPAPPPPSSNPSAPAPPPPSIGVVVKKDERGPLGDVYQQDGDWMKDIEINNLRNRYLLTKGATQQQVLSPLNSYG